MDSTVREAKVTAARTVVNDVIPRSDVTLPAPMLVRMYHELRRATLGLLEVIDDLTAAEGPALAFVRAVAQNCLVAEDFTDGNQVFNAVVRDAREVAGEMGITFIPGEGETEPEGEEPPVEEYDPGPEIDDQGGISEYGPAGMHPGIDF